VTWENRPLDVTLMSEAANYLTGEHDFSSYRATLCQAKSPIRTVHSLTVVRKGDQIILDIHANAFLHHMVRNIAGVLIDIGMGKRDPVWAREVLEYRDRKLGGVTASPHGLYLLKVDYPDVFALPETSASFIGLA
jgi:tRNA pseudouridine38-40 synthase